ncbi:hypothetical protein [Streptomyces sp. NPDC053048]|uniref:hypothetical protein n=1 Tax=Streptomyces sp. NPDC053048 TaxID=3365694 RepID=UPI0037D31336
MRLDDRFPSHRKVATLSDRAFRLHVSALCWCAANLTDGRISDKELRLVAHVRGMKATARQLEDAGLWVRDEDGWAIHDFHDYQPSAEHVRAERERNAARQKRFRDRKAEKAAAPRQPEEQPRDGRRNGVTDAVSHEASNRAPTRTRPVPGSIPAGIEPSPLHPPRGPAAAEAAGVPSFAQRLADQLADAGCHVGWRTDTDDREALRRHLGRIPTERLVDAACRAWNPANPPRSIRYLIRVWDALPDTAADAPATPIPTPWAERHQQATSDLFDRAMERARARTAALGATADDTQPKELAA